MNHIRSYPVFTEISLDGHPFAPLGEYEAREFAEMLTDVSYPEKTLAFFPSDHLEKIVTEIEYFRPEFVATLSPDDRVQHIHLKKRLAEISSHHLRDVGLRITHAFAQTLWDALGEIRETMLADPDDEQDRPDCEAAPGKPAPARLAPAR